MGTFQKISPSRVQVELLFSSSCKPKQQSCKLVCISYGWRIFIKEIYSISNWVPTRIFLDENWTPLFTIWRLHAEEKPIFLNMKPSSQNKLQVDKQHIKWAAKSTSAWEDNLLLIKISNIKWISRKNKRTQHVCTSLQLDTRKK